MMRAPPPSLESYMNSILKPSPNNASPEKTTPSPLFSSAPSFAMMSELHKLKQLQAKKQELQQQMTLIESQILKTQGALEVLQSLGLTK